MSDPRLEMQGRAAMLALSLTGLSDELARADPDPRSIGKRVRAMRADLNLLEAINLQHKPARLEVVS